MDAQQAYRALQPWLDRLRLLNPDVSEEALAHACALAEQAGSGHFGALAAFAEDLIRQYLDSPTKRIAAETLNEYFDELRRSTRLLAEQGELAHPTPPAADAHASVALVPRELYTPLEWCKVLCAADLPRDLVRAVEACRRRNELVGTVLEPLFTVMLRMDPEPAWRWQFAYLERHRGALDPDLVRDLIGAWLNRPAVPREALAWAETWSADSNLLQLWPQVVRRADRLLCRHALEAWRLQAPARSPLLGRLQRLVRRQPADDLALLSWLKAGLVEIGETILRFVSLSRLPETDDAAERAWRSGAMVREIIHLDSLFTPLLLTADRILDIPDGAHSFAVAFFGLVGRGRDQWEAKLTHLAEAAVRRAFLVGLRDGVSPVHTIRALTYGNQEALERAMGELDGVTLRFDSLKQREQVVRFLAVFYASYHEPDLLGGEILRRYRSLMRLMHEDHLRRVLLPEHAEEISRRPILRDLAAVAAAARRFLARRRALETSLAEMVAAELEFMEGIRRRRLRLIHTLFG